MKSSVNRGRRLLFKQSAGLFTACAVEKIYAENSFVRKGGESPHFRIQHRSNGEVSYQTADQNWKSVVTFGRLSNSIDFIDYTEKSFLQPMSDWEQSGFFLLTSLREQELRPQSSLFSKHNPFQFFEFGFLLWNVQTQQLDLLSVLRSETQFFDLFGNSVSVDLQDLQCIKILDLQNSPFRFVLALTSLKKNQLTFLGWDNQNYHWVRIYSGDPCGISVQPSMFTIFDFWKELSLSGLENHLQISSPNCGIQLLKYYFDRDCGMTFCVIGQVKPGFHLHQNWKFNEGRQDFFADTAMGIFLDELGNRCQLFYAQGQIKSFIWKQCAVDNWEAVARHVSSFPISAAFRFWIFSAKNDDADVLVGHDKDSGLFLINSVIESLDEHSPVTGHFTKVKWDQHLDTPVLVKKLLKLNSLIKLQEKFYDSEFLRTKMRELKSELGLCVAGFQAATIGFNFLFPYQNTNSQNHNIKMSSSFISSSTLLKNESDSDNDDAEEVPTPQLPSGSIALTSLAVDPQDLQTLSPPLQEWFYDLQIFESGQRILRGRTAKIISDYLKCTGPKYHNLWHVVEYAEKYFQRIYEKMRTLRALFLLKLVKNCGTEFTDTFSIIYQCYYTENIFHFDDIFKDPQQKYLCDDAEPFGINVPIFWQHYFTNFLAFYLSNDKVSLRTKVSLLENLIQRSEISKSAVTVSGIKLSDLYRTLLNFDAGDSLNLFVRNPESEFTKCSGKLSSWRHDQISSKFLDCCFRQVVPLEISETTNDIIKFVFYFSCRMLDLCTEPTESCLQISMNRKNHISYEYGGRRSYSQQFSVQNATADAHNFLHFSFMKKESHINDSPVTIPAMLLCKGAKYIDGPGNYPPESQRRKYSEPGSELTVKSLNRFIYEAHDDRGKFVLPRLSKEELWQKLGFHFDL